MCSQVQQAWFEDYQARIQLHLACWCAWLLQIPTSFESSYQCTCWMGRVFIPVLLLQSFNFAINSTSTWTWLRLVAILFGNISRNSTHCLVNFTTGSSSVPSTKLKIESLKSSEVGKLAILTLMTDTRSYSNAKLFIKVCHCWTSIRMACPCFPIKAGLQFAWFHRS